MPKGEYVAVVTLPAYYARNGVPTLMPLFRYSVIDLCYSMAREGQAIELMALMLIDVGKGVLIRGVG